jgi:hypothetical protein
MVLVKRKPNIALEKMTIMLKKIPVTLAAPYDNTRNKFNFDGSKARRLLSEEANLIMLTLILPDFSLS